MASSPEPAAGSRGPVARALRAAGSGLVILAIALAILELGLQVAARFAPDRTSVWRPGAETRILCVGDSHTWGTQVSREEAYPGQLQRHLDRLEPGEHSVINQGLPGLNTAQIRERLPVWIQRYRPDVIVLWAGVNNAWNRAGMERERGLFGAWLDAALSRSRLYRFVRVWMHDRELARYVPDGREDRVWHRGAVEGAFGDNPRFEVRHDGVVEEFHHERDREMFEREGEKRMEERTERDLRVIAEYARAAGVRLIFVTYPLPGSWFLAANAALRDVSERMEVPLVESGPAVRRVPAEKQDWFPDAHPGPRLYREIARDVARTIVADGDPRPVSAATGPQGAPE